MGESCNISTIIFDTILFTKIYQPISYNKSSINCQTIKKSFVENYKLILVIDNSQNITISGKNIDTIGSRKRIKELMLLTKDYGFKIQDKSVIHYTKDKDNEYVLVRW